MAELWFYHLERSSVEEVLPGLLLKLLARNGRALVISSDEDRLNRLDQHLWTFADDSFLPHGLDGRVEISEQPILLSTNPQNTNQANMLFCLDGADPGDMGGFERVIVMFEARDETTLVRARALWSSHHNSGTIMSYWKQSSQGRWEKQL